MSARIRTAYSFRQAVGKIDKVIERLKEIGSTHAPITDTASSFGWVKWDKAVRKAGMKPVFGVEIAVTKSINEKKPSTDHWTFIARDSILPLHSIIGLATSQFRYQPLLRVDQALAYNDTFTIMGHRTDFSHIEPRSNLFVACGPSLSKGQARRALDAGHNLIACSDNRFTLQGEEGLYETICGRNASTQSYPQWIMSDQEWYATMIEILPKEALDVAIDNRNIVFSASKAGLVKAEMIHPERPMSLDAMCREGAKALGCDLDRPEYAARLERELSLIESKQYEDYFYLVADICQWARKRMIVGPARGSSCGSLVCYLLNITTVDPIPHGLIFERFVDVNRTDMPDIDIDFPEHRRHEVFEYVSNKYGKDRVARLGTVSMYQPRSALKETAGAMDIAPWEINATVDVIIEREPGDARGTLATHDTLLETAAGKALITKFPEMMIAASMEAHPRHAGQHAAGIVITEKPVKETVAIDERTGATMCDKKDAEDLNLLKVDALGLTQLSIFEYALQLANLPQDHLLTIPHDDKAALDILNNGLFTGVFQFNGSTLQNIAKEVRVNDLNDIVAMTALGRPGPLSSGGTAQWIKVKRKEQGESYAHDTLIPHLKRTLGVITYQEQVMTISRDLGDLSWEDVTALRRVMGKSLGKEAFDQYGDKWKAGARKKGIPEAVVNRIWDDLCANGSYAFNHSHALAYGIVSYYCCWLKAHHPLEFAAATLTYTDSPETQIKLLRELANEGVEYIPADLELSSERWTVKKGGKWNHLVGPLSNVIGVGPKMMASIMSARHRGEPLQERASKLLTNPKTKIDSLFPIKAAFDRIMPDPSAKDIISKPMPIKRVVPNGEEYSVMVFCTLETITPMDENDEKNLAKRNGRIVTGPTAYLNLRLADDSDVIFAKIDRYAFEKLGRAIVERGRPGKALYAVKGNVPRSFRMINVKNVRYIGDIENG